MFRRKRTALLPVMIIILLFSAGFHLPVAAETGVKIYIEGSELSTDIIDVPPFILEGRTMVPLRAVSEGLDLRVTWDEVNRHVLISQGEGPYPLQKTDGGEKHIVRIFINGKELGPDRMDVPPVIVRGRTMVPLRAVSEGFGLQVDWNAEMRYVTIVKPVPSGDGDEAAEIPEIPEEPKKPEETEEPVIPERPENPLNPSRGQNPVEREIEDWGLREMVPIMGSPVASAAELRKAVQKINPDAPDLAELYINIGREYGIRGDIAFFQAAHETGWWKYGGLVKPEQNNYCGLSATGAPAGPNELLRGADPRRVWFVEGEHGAFFACEATGVEAQIQHLYAYATTAALPAGKALLSPRFQILEQLDRRGKAAHWEELGGWWAVPGFDRSRFGSFEEAYNQGATYGQHILNLYTLHTGHRL